MTITSATRVDTSRSLRAPRPALRAFLVYVALASASTACGLGLFADEGGGADNLPLRGAGPYRVQAPDFDTPADEPYVVAQPIVSLLDPAVLGDEIQGYEIFYTRIEDQSSEIWQVELPSIDQLPSSAPQPVLAADADWEQGVVASPSLFVDGEARLLYYRGGVDQRAIGRARSEGPGQPFVKDPGNPLFAGDDPFLAKSGERSFLVYCDPEHRRIYLRESEGDDEFGEAQEILARRTGSELAFDRLAVSAPALLITPTLEGSLHFGLFYAGTTRNQADEAVEAIGYVARFEGESWQRFLKGTAIVDAGPAGAGGPAPVIGVSSATLFFHQPRQGRGRIAVALAP